MDRLIDLGMKVMKDAYNKGHADFHDYWGSFSIEELTDFRFLRMLNKYGSFTFHYEDKIWTNYKLTYAGEKFVEKGDVLKYDGKAIDSDWISLILITAGFSIAGIILSVLLYKLTLFINDIDKDVALKSFQAITAFIIFDFCRRYRYIHDRNVWRKNKYTLVLYTFFLLYMIVYGSICLKEEVVGRFPIYLQYGTLGTILWHLYSKKY